MTVATFQTPSSCSTSSALSTSTRLPTAKSRKLSLNSYSSSQSVLASKKLRLLSDTMNNNDMAMASATPHANSQLSRSSSTSSTMSSRSKPPLTLDLSNLPALSRPSPPSNTLIITELHNLLVFQPPCLAAIRETLTAVAPLNSFSPLPSFRRIVCSFPSTDTAVKARQTVETTKTIFDECGVRARIYFGEHTPIESTEEAKRKKLLEAPHSQKLFFISPPPSPPHGWVMRNEDPPNKDVHARDLVDALSRLKTATASSDPDPDLSMGDPLSPVSVASSSSDLNNNGNSTSSRDVTPGLAHSGSARSRSSTLIFHPNDHGGSPNLPAVMVEDTSVDIDGDLIDEDIMNLSEDSAPKKILAHTSRPPVELME